MKSIWLAFLLFGCTTTTVAPFTDLPTVTPSTAPSSSLSPSSNVQCLPTDQDQYVYHPYRLVVLSPCATASGTIYSIKAEADGDLHIRLTLDPEYQGLINSVNVSGQLGKLVIEPVCVKGVTQADAIDICSKDTDPIDISNLAVGQHVTITGRYVTDTQHGGWAEFHPLYSLTP